MRGIHAVLLPLVLALAAACDGSPTDPPAARLDEAAIRDVAGRIRFESMVVLSILPYGMRFNVLACAPDGAILSEFNVNARSVDPLTGAERMTGQSRETHAACGWATASGTAVRVDGTLEHRFEVNVRQNGQAAFSGTGSMVGTGTLVIRDPSGRSRECLADLTFAYDYETRRGTVKGVFCEAVVSEDLDLAALEL